MYPCLIQQLFRQKIGKELDHGLIDEFIFPLLLPRKHLAKELLLDIKLTRCSAHSALGEETGVSAIIIPRLHLIEWDHGYFHKNIPPFTPVRPALLSAGQHTLRQGRTPGKTTSQYRRKMVSKHEWGSIEILNELRGLNHPHIGYHISQDHQSDVLEFPTGPNTSEELDMFIRLEEGPEVWASEMLIAKHKEREKGLVNDFLEDSLVNDNGLSWGGDPENLFEPVLSTHY